MDLLVCAIIQPSVHPSIHTFRKSLLWMFGVEFNGVTIAQENWNWLKLSPACHPAKEEQPLRHLRQWHVTVMVTRIETLPIWLKGALEKKVWSCLLVDWKWKWRSSTASLQSRTREVSIALAEDNLSPPILRTHQMTERKWANRLAPGWNKPSFTVVVVVVYCK